MIKNLIFGVYLLISDFLVETLEVIKRNRARSLVVSDLRSEPKVPRPNRAATYPIGFYHAGSKWR